MMHFLRYGVALFMMLAGMWVGISIALPKAEARLNNNYGNQPACAETRYGRCLGSNYQQYPYGESVGYPYAAVESPGPYSVDTGDAVQNHANWMYNKERYQRINDTYYNGNTGNFRTQRRNIGGGYGINGGYGNDNTIGPQPFSNNQNYRPYPRYGAYAYRLERDKLRTVGPSVVFRGTTTQYRQPTVKQIHPNITYITTREAKLYAALYNAGVTTLRRPKGSVIGHAATPWPPSHYGY